MARTARRNPYLVTQAMREWREDQKVTAVVVMRPSDFLALTTGSAAHREDILREALTLEKYNEYAAAAATPVPPMLQVALSSDRDGYVVGHEGRHRAAATMLAGENELEVSLMLVSADGYPSRQFCALDIPLVWRCQYLGSGYDWIVDRWVDKPFKLESLVAVLDGNVQRNYQKPPRCPAGPVPAQALIGTIEALRRRSNPATSPGDPALLALIATNNYKHGLLVYNMRTRQIGWLPQAGAHVQIIDEANWIADEKRENLVYVVLYKHEASLALRTGRELGRPTKEDEAARNALLFDTAYALAPVLKAAGIKQVFAEEVGAEWRLSDIRGSL